MAAATQTHKTPPIQKQSIFFTRDYRHLPRPQLSMWLFVAVFVLPVFAGILLFYPQISFAVATWVSGVITGNTGVPTAVISSDFIPMIGPVYLVEIAGSLPTRLFSILNFVIAGIILFYGALFRKKGFRAMVIYVCIAMFIHMIASFYFIFFPEYFPYTLVNYSELYMEQQIALWICIAGISGFAIALIFSSFLSKLIAFAATMVYTGLYGVTRYVIYLLVLHYFSSLYMATLFFTLGMLFDFLQMVFIYVLYVQHASKGFGKPKMGRLWRWA